MASSKVDVLSLRTKGRASLTEKNGEIRLKADDPVSALQAIANQANIKINLTPEEVERLTGAGKLKITLSYPNKLSGATEAIKKIDQLTSDAIAASGQTKKKPGAFWKNLGLMILVLLVGAMMFVATVVVLEIINGSNVKLPFLH